MTFFAEMKARESRLANGIEHKGYADATYRSMLWSKMKTSGFWYSFILCGSLGTYFLCGRAWQKAESPDGSDK